MDAITNSASYGKLSKSAISVEAQFGSTVDLSAEIFGANENHASEEVSVRFLDYYASGQPVGGYHNDLQLTTTSTSTATATYTPGNIAPDTTIWLKVIVLDENGFDTNITDSVSIEVIDFQ